LAAIHILDGDLAAARARLEDVLVVDPLFPRANERIGLIDLSEGKPDAAMKRFQAEYRMNHWPQGFDLRMGMVHQQRGELEKAVAAYRRELSRNPRDAEARDSLASVMRALGR